ncbi:hypothetical protein BGZ82_003005, partial [Podila clonocystis]
MRSMLANSRDNPVATYCTLDATTLALRGPDGTILKEQFDVVFAEIKAPKDDNSTRLYIQDKWALTSLAKDTIDLHLRER